MNRILLSTLMAISSIAGVNARAESPTPTPVFEATADRAQVLAELESFRALPNNPWSPAHESQTRAPGRTSSWPGSVLSTCSRSPVARSTPISTVGPRYCTVPTTPS